MKLTRLERCAIAFGVVWLGIVLALATQARGEALCSTDSECAEVCRAMGEDCDGGLEPLR